MFKLSNYNIILPKYYNIVKKKGSSFVFSALGGWDKEKSYKSAKKNAVGNEGVAEGGGLGEEFRHAQVNTKSGQPCRPARQSRSQQKSFLFLLKEKNRGAQIKKYRENFFAGWRGFRATAGLASLVGILFKKSSNIVQKTPPNCAFCKIVRGCLGAKRLGMVFFRYNPRFFEVARQRAVGNAEVRRAKLWQNEILQTNLFLSASRLRRGFGGQVGAGKAIFSFLLPKGI